MPEKLYCINLNDEEQQTLFEMTRKGKIKARQMKRAMILLKANEGLFDRVRYPKGRLRTQETGAIKVQLLFPEMLTEQR